jgi:hypothetical protein
LKPKGYGETQPRNACTDGVACSEYEHQRNRRTEFRVVGGSINLEIAGTIRHAGRPLQSLSVLRKIERELS